MYAVLYFFAQGLVHLHKTNKGADWRYKDVTQTQQQRPESPMVNTTFINSTRNTSSTICASAPNRAQELCESGGGRPGLPVTDSPYGLCGRKATLNVNILNIIHRLDFFSLSKLQPWKTPC